MTISQTEKGLFEKGFDEDISRGRFEELLAVFPTTEAMTSLLLRFRDEDGFVDMKRGELYPEVIGAVARLRRTIASVYGLKVVQAQPNFGCNGCIDSLFSFIQRLDLTDNRRNGLVLAIPSYFRYYHKVDALKLRFVGVPFVGDYRYPADRVLEVIKQEKVRCLVLVAPNNPTGVPITDQEILYVLDNVPDDVYIAIDRTCVSIEAEVTTKNLLEKYGDKNLVIFQSFSKYFGMSHLRIGFSVFSNERMAREVDRYLPFGLNLEAALKATYVLMTQGELRPSSRIITHIQRNKVILTGFLNKHIDYTCTDFKSNYALMFLPKRIDSKTFSTRLQAHGISVFPGHEAPEPDEQSVRIHTGGNPEYLERMVSMIGAW